VLIPSGDVVYQPEKEYIAMMITKQLTVISKVIYALVNNERLTEALLALQN